MNYNPEIMVILQNGNWQNITSGHAISFVGIILSVLLVATGIISITNPPIDDGPNPGFLLIIIGISIYLFTKWLVSRRENRKNNENLHGKYSSIR
jgi:hypothetical protein